MAPLTGWPSSYHHRDAAERTGRRLGHGAQLFAGPEVLKILARVARGISGAAKGAQIAARLEEVAALQRGQLASEVVAAERVGETIPKYVAYRTPQIWGCVKSPKKSKKSFYKLAIRAPGGDF